MTTELLHVTVETSVLPPVSVGSGKPPASGASKPGPLRSMLARVKAAIADTTLGFVRPRVTVESSLLGTAKVSQPYGAPMPWPLGLAIMLIIIIMPAGLIIYAVVRRFRRGL